MNAAPMLDKALTDAESPSSSSTPHNSNQHFSCLQTPTLQAGSAGIATGEQASRQHRKPHNFTLPGLSRCMNSPKSFPDCITSHAGFSSQ